MTVVRVRRRETLHDEAVKGLILRAVERTRYPGTTPITFFHEMAQTLASNYLGLFVGYEEEVPKALGIAYLPSSQASLAPQVVLAYNEGHHSLILAVAERMKAWMQHAGYDSMIAIALRHRPEAWRRAFGRLGKQTEIGAVIECRF